MALPGIPNPISMSQVNVELGRSSTATINFSDAYFHEISHEHGIIATNDTIAMSQARAQSWLKPISVTLSANTNQYNIWTNKPGTYRAGRSALTVTINSNVWVYGTTVPGLGTGSGWSTACTAVGGDSIHIVNNGYVAGFGGAGGEGGSEHDYTLGLGTGGTTGGDSFSLSYGVTITNASGWFYGGGGGGAGGQAYMRGNWPTWDEPGDDTFTGGGGGGGGGRGFIGGLGAGAGRSAYGGSSGGNGDINGGGAGGTGGFITGFGDYGETGGSGGDWGSSGGTTGGGSSLGGAGGYAIRKNGYNITWVSGSDRVAGLVS